MGRLFSLFLVMTIAEIYVMKIVAEEIGYFKLLLFVLFTGVLGVSMAKQQGRELLVSLQKELAVGHTPSGALLEGMMILVAGAVLITPGFLTDALGFSLLVPAVRKYLAPKFVKWFMPKPGAGGFTSFHFHSNSQESGGSHFGEEPKDDFFDMPEEEKEKPGIDEKK